MLDPLFDLAREALSSPWAYVAIFAFVAADAVLPALPGETLVISAGVFAASGSPDLLPVVATAAAGAFAGDHLSYLVGKLGRGPLRRRAARGTRLTGALDRGRAMLDARGGSMLIVARYIPGGRTATTLTAGAVGFSLRVFTAYVTVSAITWGLYCTLIGYVGGSAFEDDPLLGLVLGLSLAVGVAGIVEIVRIRLRRRREALVDEAARRAPEEQPVDAPTASGTAATVAGTTMAGARQPTPGRPYADGSGGRR